jgi:hypothetical protein
MRKANFAFRLGVGMSLAATCSALHANDWDRHIPAGWQIIGESAEGANAVLMIEENNPAKKIKNPYLGPEIWNTNPRKLLFLRSAGGKYRQIGQADNFLPPENDAETPCLVDPLGEGGMSLAKGILTISFSYWLSCGSYGSAKTSFKFRLEGNRYRLIGLDSLEFSRASGEGEETSINYLTGRKSYTADVQVIQVDDHDKPVERRKTWSRVGREKFYLDAMNQAQCNGRASAPSWCLSD